jgi:hypothetical protein
MEILVPDLWHALAVQLQVLTLVKGLIQLGQDCACCQVDLGTASRFYY